MTDARNVPRERVEQFIEEIHAAEGDYGIGLAITAMEAYMDAAPPARECAPPFDKTWLIAALNVHRHLGVPPRDSDFMLWKRENDKWLGEAVAALREYAGLAAGAAPERPHAIEIDVYGGPEEAPAAEPCYYCGRVHSEADPYCVKPAAEPAPDQSAAMRPREQEISQRMDTGYAQVADPVDALCALLEEDAREETQRGNRITAQYEREAAAALRTLQQERDHHKKMRELGWSWLSCPMCGEELSGEYKERGELRAERDKLQERVAELELDKSGLARTSVNLLQSLAKADTVQ